MRSRIPWRKGRECWRPTTFSIVGNDCFHSCRTWGRQRFEQVWVGDLAGRTKFLSQPYGFRFCESFAQFASFGARCIFRGRRKTRPTLWFQILRKLPTICSFWTCEMHFVWQAQDAAHFSWQALYESTNRKVGNAWKIIFSCVFSAKVTVRLDFCGRCSTLWLSGCFCVAGPRLQNRKVGFSWQVQYFVTGVMCGTHVLEIFDVV